MWIYDAHLFTNGSRRYIEATTTWIRMYSGGFAWYVNIISVSLQSALQKDMVRMLPCV